MGRNGSSAKPGAGVLVVGACLAVGAAGCSENFGPPPPDANRRLAVAEESFAGPVPSRTLLTLSGAGGRWLVGTDAGLYRVEAPWTAPRFFPEHGGFTDLTGRTGISSVSAVAIGEQGELILFRARFGATDYLSFSDDGGQNYTALPLPVPSSQRADRLYAWAASARSGEGRIAVAQGASLFWRSSSGSQWEAVGFSVGPSWSPVGFGAAWQDRNGLLWLSVQSASGWAIFRSEDGGRNFDDTGLRPSQAVLAVATEGSTVHWVTASEWVGGSEERRWPGHEIRAARLRVDEAGLSYAILALETSSGSYRLAVGKGLPARLEGLDLDFAPVIESLHLDLEGVGLGAAEGTLHRFAFAGGDSPFAFGGGDLDWGAIAVSADLSEIFLAQARSGAVYRGVAEDPAAMQSLGSPLFQSQPRALHVEAGRAPGVYAGSFGVHYLPAGSVVWQGRDGGQFSYLLENFSGPVKPQVIDQAPEGTLWLGAIQGDGPYRSANAGQFWTPVHGGLGAPGSRPGEDGLPRAPQVNAFAFAPELDGSRATWMATFRGGVWRLADGATPFWEPVNRGLVDNAGAVVDSCCFDTDSRAVDVRDLVVLADGSLLAATGFGAYRLGPSRSRWESSSLGLANSDLRALAVDPQNPQRVVGVARGSAGNDTWLVFSQDSGQSWISVASSLVAKHGVDVVWSRPDRNEVVAILETQGAWRVVLIP